ncbi:MAG: nuclear transport factor 2 family protein [Pseudomonadales bacterium]|jgi:hypothetical protein
MKDDSRIRETVQVYFDSRYESSAEKVHAAFHPNARISGYMPNGFSQKTVQGFAGVYYRVVHDASEYSCSGQLDCLWFKA